MSSIRESPDIIAAVKVARAAGLCVIPPRQDGTKAPGVPAWKRYQSEGPSAAELTTWYRDLHYTGVGYVTGAVSGIECFEFDDAETHETFMDTAPRVGYGDLIDRIEQGYSDRSPSGGVHWYYRCSEISGNAELAKRPIPGTIKAEVLIETRGEGGYVIAAPSHGGTVHPSGKPYTALYGSPSTIATITPQERPDLFQLARTFDEMPVPTVTGPGASRTNGSRPGDVFNERATWPEILEPHGWQLLYERAGVGYWRRPGKQHGQSATTNYGGYDCLRVFTSSTVLESKMYQKFTAYAALNHGGDYRTAARDLAQQGYGNDEPPAVSTTSTGHAAPSTHSEQAAVFRLQTRRAADIEPREIEWIWKPWLPAGMVGLFAGYGGSGKSTVALSIAAACSVGGTLPDGQPAPMLNTLIFAAEDSPEYTIVTRLKLLGADMSRIHIVDGVAEDSDTDPAWVRFQNHMPAIEAAIHELDIGLVIIDPISSYIGNANGDKESDVRMGLMPAVHMAERTGAAVLMIRHVSKAGDGSRAASRILGSTAWHDVPRVAWMLADAPIDYQPKRNEDGLRDTHRVLGVVKSNIAAKPQARWCVQPVDGPLRWLSNPSPVSIDQCFAPPSDDAGKTSLERAEEWLADYLAGGMKPSDEAWQARKDAGIGEKAYKRARQNLKIQTHMIQKRWHISLPSGAIQEGQSLGLDPLPPLPSLSDTAPESTPHTRKDPESSQEGSIAPLAPLYSRGGQKGKEGNQANIHPVALLTPETDSEPLAPTGTDDTWSMDL